ncbi:MAG: hypothetical protein KDA80_07235 [Planctomycetaceae bacterium]|nr:hypothetical protein [Planctomycetaceae bacterium]
MTNDETAHDFEQAAMEPAPGIVREFWQFLRENKAWWLLPLLISLAILGIAVWVGMSPLAPLIYPLF